MGAARAGFPETKHRTKLVTWFRTWVVICGTRAVEVKRNLGSEGIDIGKNEIDPGKTQENTGKKSCMIAKRRGVY